MGPQTLMILMAFHMLLLLQLSEERSDNTSLIYKAAVVEYSAPLGISLDTKEAHYKHNAETFAKITKRAAELDCDIIVFPEYGLLSMDLPKLEDGSPSLAIRIPKPEAKINPCVDDKGGLYKDLLCGTGKAVLSLGGNTGRISLMKIVTEVYGSTEIAATAVTQENTDAVRKMIKEGPFNVTECGGGRGSEDRTSVPKRNISLPMCTDLQELSCAARNNQIYVVVNVVEAEKCSSAHCGACPGSSTPPEECTTTDRLCPKNEFFYYNSNVVFDREGNVIARYRMYHLYGEMPLVPPDNPEYTVIDTDFGIRFGMFISFDMSFKEPASKLIRELGVRDILYTTCWFSEMPFQTAVQYQAAWSHAMDVNFLSSGYNYPEYGTGGSGIFAGKMGTLVAVMPQVRSSYLLVATVVKKHAPCYDQFFKVLPNAMVIPLPGETGDKEEPPYEYDRNNPVKLPAVAAKSPSQAPEAPPSPKEVQREQWEGRDTTVEEQYLEENVELETAEKRVEEREELEEEEEEDSQATMDRGQQKERKVAQPSISGLEPEKRVVERGESEEEEDEDSQAAGGNLDKDRGQQKVAQPSISGVEPSSEKKCSCSKKSSSESASEDSREPPEERDYPEPAAEFGGTGKCAMKNLNGKLEGNAPVENREEPEGEEQSEPATTDSGEKKCDVKSLKVKLEDNAPKKSKMPSQEEDYSEQSVKVGGKNKCDLKTSDERLEENGPEDGGEPPEGEDQSEPPVKNDGEKKCDVKSLKMKLEENAGEKSRKPPQGQDYSEPAAKVGRRKPCDVKSLNVKLEGSAPDEPPTEEDYSEPPVEDDGQKKCDVKSLKQKVEDSAPEETGDGDFSTESPRESPEEVGGEIKCGGRTLSLDTKLQAENDEQHQQSNGGDSSDPSQGRDESRTEEDLGSKEPSGKGKGEVLEYPEEGGGGKCQQGTEKREGAEDMIDEGEYKENVATRESTEEEVVTNLPHPCIEESLFKRYAKKWLPSYVLPQNKPGSGLHVKRERLENYITFRLTSDRMKENSSVRLCHGTFCCDFEVVMCSGGECYGGECSGEACSSSDGPRYNYRLVAFDGLRSMDQFGEGRYQVCAVISCTDESLQSCGQFIKDPKVNVRYTRFYKLLISGVFKRLNTIIGANTVAHNLLPLPVSKFEFYSEYVSDDELAVKMSSLVPELTFLTFGIYGRNYDVDDFRINKLVCEA